MYAVGLTAAASRAILMGFMRHRAKGIIAGFCVFLAIAAPSTAATKYDQTLFDVYPAARAYVQEVNGNVTITFVHNLDSAGLGAIAETNVGKMHGNWDRHSVPAPAGQSLLVRGAVSPQSATQTTLTFRDQPLAKVKVFHIVFAHPDVNDVDVIVMLDPTLDVSPSDAHARVPVTGTVHGARVNLSNGVSLEGQPSLNYSNSATGQMTEATAASGVVRRGDGAVLLRAGRIQFVPEAAATTRPG
jgi:hypothetical protein